MSVTYPKFNEFFCDDRPYNFHQGVFEITYDGFKVRSCDNESSQKSSKFFHLLWAFTVRGCLAGIIIRTKNLDEPSILGAAVSILLLNFDNFIYRIFYHG